MLYLCKECLQLYLCIRPQISPWAIILRFPSRHRHSFTNSSYVHQNVEFRINKGVLGLSKEISHKVWEFRGSVVSPHNSREFHDLYQHLQVPICPPTVADVCKVLEIYYILKVSIYLLFYY